MLRTTRDGCLASSMPASKTMSKSTSMSSSSAAGAGVRKYVSGSSSTFDSSASHCSLCDRASWGGVGCTVLDGHDSIRTSERRNKELGILPMGDRLHETLPAQQKEKHLLETSNSVKQRVL
jgi:hypothetical protein